MNNAVYTGHNITSEQNERIYPKLPTGPPSVKNTTITFRVTNELRAVLEKAAEINGVSLSLFISAALEQYCGTPLMEHKKAQYLNTCSSEKQEKILGLEEDLPHEFRDFTDARRAHPNAGTLSPEDAERVKYFLGKTGADK